MNTLDFSNFSSFQELDVQYGQTKGWAFKRFKQLESSLIEGEDFVCLRHQEQPEAINDLRASGRIYASTVNLVMLSPSGVAKFKHAVTDSPS